MAGSLPRSLRKCQTPFPSLNTLPDPGVLFLVVMISLSQRECLRMPSQGYSKGTQAMATAARNVAKTAIPNAFKNGLFPTVRKLKTVENKPFSYGGNHYLETLNLNFASSPKSK